MTAASLDRTLAYVRTGTAALAVAVALFLLLRVPVVATFRAALVALAALELLAFGRQALAREGSWSEWSSVAVKLAVLAIAYLAVSS